MFRSFKGKLIIYFGLLFIIVQMITFLIVYKAAKNFIHKDITKRLNTVNEVFQNRVLQRAKYLRTEALLLSTNQKLKNAINSNDLDLALDVLSESIQVIENDRIILLFNGDDVIIETNSKTKISEQIDNALIMEGQKGISLLRIGDKYYIFVKVPAANAKTKINPDGYFIGIGEVLNRKSILDIKNNYSLDIDLSFFLVKNGHYYPMISSFDNKTQSSLTKFINTNKVSFNHLQTSYLDNSKYLLLGIKQKEKKLNGYLEIVIAYSFAGIEHSINVIMFILFVIFLISFIVVILGAWFLGSALINPLHNLATAVQLISKGDYNIHLPIKGKDELSQLAKSFQTMTLTIQARDEQNRQNSLLDIATGLPNRRYFEELLQQEIYKDEPNLTIVFFKIDRFVEINNTLGHDFGDKVISEIKDRLLSIDNISAIAKIGTSSFGFIVRDEHSHIKPMCDYLHSILEMPYAIDKAVVDISPHFGVCEIDNDISIDVKLWIRHVDYALYHAYENGERYIFYNKSFDNRSRNTLSMMGEFTKGIIANEFEIWLQPKVNIKLGNVVQAEVLIRWNHPEQGLILPDEFIPLAEQTGNIYKLTDWLINASLILVRDWLDKGWDIKIAINISAKDLNDLSLSTTIIEKLKEYSVPASSLVLEITESAIMKDPEFSLNTLRILNDMGIFLAIDDFGTGYSSMEYLKQLPVDELKIDKSFITKLDEEAEDAIIVSSIIDLAHNMGLEVVAEGIENHAVLEVLYDYNCDCGQGYYFSKPVKASEFLIMVEKLTFKGFSDNDNEFYSEENFDNNEL